MTPAERDEARQIASETIDAHTLRHSQTGATLPCACGSCLAARAVLRYVPPGVCIEIDTKALPVEFATVGIRNAAHALHAAADAAEES